ncbi:HAD family hydrolase [Brevibacillus invocatus]|uniref:HAD family hydrolase n=1 Tax=Brevibacillus invocatus TaxID=173959 RepID=A0A3M8C3X6_9BACL|nr:HAD family hydrolase [Brevibacillus invocatus]MCM3079254.1 HAD family hydrolase [Brevibacillus invocatus]MCM3429352.1 HAD family hydrolase [Brevibacillus invocatus]RNB70344.1 HAD family hydrolase [Brevibacillus invocatus]
MIRFIWFDLGYTLVRMNREEVYQKVLGDFDVYRSVEEIALAYHRTDKLFMREYQGVLGKDSRAFLPWYVGALNYKLRLSLPIEDVVQVYRQRASEYPLQWTAYEGAKETLQGLKNLGYQLGLISNWDQTARQVLKKNGLDEVLDEIVISSEVGLEKPDPGIFRLAMEKGNVTSNQSLYIGDNYYDDVIGCQKVGMHCLLINPYGNCGVEELTYQPVIRGIQDVADYLGHPQQRREVN